MRPLLQLAVTNVTQITSFRRTPKGSNDISGQTPSQVLVNERATKTQPTSAHTAPNSVQQMPDRAGLQGSEYNVNTWHSNSKEELLHMRGDIELSGAIYQKSEVAVTEEIVNEPDKSGRE